jgi:hypothetical protein
VPYVLGDTKDEVYCYLVANEIHGVEVEILQALNYFKPSLFPVYPSDPAVAVYEKSCQAIVKLLQKTIRSFWKGLCLFNVGREKDNITPTVVVTVTPRAIFDWSWLGLQICNMLDHRESVINIEFLPGDHEMLAD